jgi:hypothetical protein
MLQFSSLKLLIDALERITDMFEKAGRINDTVAASRLWVDGCRAQATVEERRLDLRTTIFGDNATAFLVAF